MAEDAILDTICHAPDRAHRLSLDYLLSCVPRSARRVLDCAVAPGARAAALREHGARTVVGLFAETPDPGDPSGYDVVIPGPIDFAALPPVSEPFDCILCTGVLERLRNPDAFIPALLERLAPGGLFLATVPNMQYHKIVCALAEGRWAYGDSGVWDRNNLRFYTAREIRQHLQIAGLSSIRIAGLVGDSPSDFPRDKAGYARCGRLRIGPMDDAAYPAWLAEYYLVVAAREGG